MTETEPRFTPMSPDFPFRVWTHAQLDDTAGAPMSFTSATGADFPLAPQLDWRAVLRIQLAEARDPVHCDSCREPLVVYGFAAQRDRAVIARACLTCKLRYMEPISRDALVERMVVWGFSKPFSVNGHSATIQGANTPSDADAARRQLLESMLPDSMKGGHLG